MKSLLKERLKEQHAAREDLALGCSKCRYSKTGCARCRKSSFNGRRGAQPVDQAALDVPVKAKETASPRKRRRLNNNKAVVPASTGDDCLNHLNGAALGNHPASGDAQQNATEHRSRGAAPAEAHSSGPAVSFIYQPSARKDAASSASLGVGLGLRRDQEETSTGAVGASQLLASPANEQAAQPTQTPQLTPVRISGPAASETPLASVGGAPEACGRQGSALQRGGEFLEKLMQTVHRRREERNSGAASQSSAESRGSEGLLRLATGRRQRLKDERQGNRLAVVGDPRVAAWEPPASPFSLIEEELYEDPWRLLIACLLLNKTSGTQVRRVIGRLFELMPTAEAAVAASTAAIQDIILPLGLANKRAPMLQRFSKEYLEENWRDPRQLHGCGQYAADAYFIFCRGEWRSVQPADKDLRRYREWLAATDGQGMGLLREHTDGTAPLLGTPSPSPIAARWCSVPGLKV